MRTLDVPKGEGTERDKVKDDVILDSEALCWNLPKLQIKSVVATWLALNAAKVERLKALERVSELETEKKKVEETVFDLKDQVDYYKQKHAESEEELTKCKNNLLEAEDILTNVRALIPALNALLKTAPKILSSTMSDRLGVSSMSGMVVRNVEVIEAAESMEKLFKDFKEKEKALREQL